MATITISYGTRQWLAELLQAGWEASIVERRDVRADSPVLLAEHLAELNRVKVQPAMEVGVLVTDGHSGSFIPCATKAEAVELLKSALMEVTIPSRGVTWLRSRLHGKQARP